MKHYALKIFFPVLIYILVISVNFLKPFGFFRESNPAIVCINYNIWKQYPVLKNHLLPIGSYTYNPDAKRKAQLWAITFGYGWFLAPYLFLSFLNLPANEITIRIFSLFWLLFTLVIVGWLSRKIQSGLTSKTSSITYLTILFYVFNAAVLWYHVHGYVHEVAVIPFYFLNWLFFIKFIETNALKWLVTSSIGLFVSVQFDWLPCFQGGVMFFYLLLNRNKTGHRFSFLFPVFGVILGVALIVYTYASFISLEVLMGTLKEKFLARTIGGGALQILPGVNHNINIVVFYLTGFGLLFLFLLRD